jgi:hypothetical protein
VDHGRREGRNRSALAFLAGLIQINQSSARDELVGSSIQNQVSLRRQLILVNQASEPDLAAEPHWDATREVDQNQVASEREGQDCDEGLWSLESST